MVLKVDSNLARPFQMIEHFQDALVRINPDSRRGPHWIVHNGLSFLPNGVRILEVEDFCFVWVLVPEKTVSSLKWDQDLIISGVSRRFLMSIFAIVFVTRIEANEPGKWRK
jgi:hypothetical protein